MAARGGMEKGSILGTGGGDCALVAGWVFDHFMIETQT